MANVTTAYTATGNVCNIILNKFTINNTLSLDTTNCDYPLATHWYAPRPLVTHAAQKKCHASISTDAIWWVNEPWPLNYSLRSSLNELIAHLWIMTARSLTTWFISSDWFDQTFYNHCHLNKHYPLVRYWQVRYCTVLVSQMYCVFSLGYFQPVRQGNNVYVDGGLLCNYPLHVFDGRLQLNFWSVV